MNKATMVLAVDKLVPTLESTRDDYYRAFSREVRRVLGKRIDIAVAQMHAALRESEEEQGT